MNKKDMLLIGIVLIISLLGMVLLNGIQSTNAVATIYYDSKLVQTIDLSIDKVRTFEIEGYNGTVVFETKKNAIRVKEEISPLHICSNMGYIDSSYETIVCLPNKIVVKIEEMNQNIDTVVK